jgi:hypothetical protein
MGYAIEVKYFNTFLLKKVVNEEFEPVYGGSFGVPAPLNGSWPTADLIDTSNNKEWFIEESRIQGGYNNTTVDLGVKAYIVDNDTEASIRGSSMIYSGVYNSRTGINNTNQFSVGEEITKSLDPSNGSIQKLYAEDTNLIIFQENKVSRSLIDKDAIYSAEGSPVSTTSDVVIGQNISYAGNYGISKDPLSFAVYGYRKYFTDRYRNAVLRLSQDGITEISDYGMIDYFRDTFATINSSQYGQGKIIGGWDSYSKQYVVSLQRDATNPSSYYDTLNFDDQVNGFTSFFSFKPDTFFSIRSNVYSTYNGVLWLHYSESVPVNNFYGVQSKSSITFVFNDLVGVSKNFKTVNYEGDNGWQVDEFISDKQGFDFGDVWYNFQSTNDKTAQVPSYLMGAYDSNGNTYPTLLTPPIYRYGFERKENKYYANLINNSLPTSGEVVYGNKISGIRGRFSTVTFSTDSITDVGGIKELWSVGTEYSMSSY